MSLHVRPVGNSEHKIGPLRLSHILLYIMRNSNRLGEMLCNAVKGATSNYRQTHVSSLLLGAQLLLLIQYSHAIYRQCLHRIGLSYFIHPPRLSNQNILATLRESATTAN